MQTQIQPILNFQSIRKQIQHFEHTAFYFYVRVLHVHTCMMIKMFKHVHHVQLFEILFYYSLYQLNYLNWPNMPVHASNRKIEVI